MKKVLAVWKIVRFFNVFIAFLSIILAGIVCGKESIPIEIILLAAFSGAFATAAGNVINDIFDVEIDKINRPDRILPKGDLTLRQAVYIYIILNSCAVLTAMFLNTFAFLIVLVSIIIIFLYSYELKKVPLLGNIVVAGLTGLVFLFGGTAVGNIMPAFLPAIFAFCLNFVREIVKDMQDMKGDKQNNVITFPQKYGLQRAVKVVFVGTLALIILTFVPFFLHYYKIEYFVVIMISVNLILVYFLKLIKNNEGNYTLMSILLKVDMIFGLVAIYLGV